MIGNVLWGLRNRRAGEPLPLPCPFPSPSNTKEPRRDLELARPPAARARPPLDALHPHGRLRRGPGRADHRQGRRLLPLGLERQALPRRARRPVLGQHRLRLRRGDRAGGARADARAAVLHQLVVRAPEGDRARGRARLARARRPEPRLLRLGRLGGGRVGVEARPAVLRGPRREAGQARARRARDAARRDRLGRASRPAPLQGDRAAHRLPRHDDGRPLDQRHPGAADGVRAARARGAARPQHEPLPPAGGRDRGGVHAVPARRPRAGDPRDGARDRLPRAHGARAERRRLLHCRPRATGAACARSATSTTSCSPPTR